MFTVGPYKGMYFKDAYHDIEFRSYIKSQRRPRREYQEFLSWFIETKINKAIKKLHRKGAATRDALLVIYDDFSIDIVALSPHMYITNELPESHLRTKLIAAKDTIRDIVYLDLSFISTTYYGDIELYVPRLHQWIKATSWDMILRYHWFEWATDMRYKKHTKYTIKL